MGRHLLDFKQPLDYQDSLDEIAINVFTRKSIFDPLL